MKVRYCVKIVNIDFNEKKMNFIIELDTDEKLNISYEIYEKYSLKKDLELDTLIYDKLKEEDSFIKAKDIAMNFTSYKPRTIFELERKLKLKNISQINIDKTIAYLVDKGFLNDEYYAEEFFKQCLQLKNYSLRKTSMKFFEKGLDKNLFEDMKEKYYSDDIEEENARITARKKARNMDLNDIKSFNKAYRYLLGRGFSYGLSKRVLEELKNEE